MMKLSPSIYQAFDWAVASTRLVPIAVFIASLLILSGCADDAHSPGVQTSAGAGSEATAASQQSDASDDAPAADAEPASDESESEAATEPERATAVMAGGCFWCVEPVFEQMEGVIDVTSGYAGGSAESAEYDIVVTGVTDHAESVRIIYDPAVVSYEKLVRVHLAMHDPTELNRQGPDVGRHYRSAIFYVDDEQKAIAERVIDELQASDEYDEPIVTTLERLDGWDEFYVAEDYHQDYAEKNPNNSYIRFFALPKIQKMRERFPDALR